MSESSQLQLKLINLNCYRQDESDGDEVFLKYGKNKIWPEDTKYVKVQEGSYKVQVDLNEIGNGSMISIELWDYDFLTPNDKLGEFSMLVNERGGPFTTDLKATGSQDAKYSLEWEVS